MGLGACQRDCACKCTVHILCLYGDTVHLGRVSNGGGGVGVPVRSTRCMCEVFCRDAHPSLYGRHGMCVGYLTGGGG